MKKRIILGKMGLDSHDNGVIIVAKWLADAGYEVIYVGLYNSPESLVKNAIQEDVDAIGCSFLGGEHLYYARKLIDAMKDYHMKDVKIILGGVIPYDDVEELKKIGVSLVFTPGTLKEKIIEQIDNLFQTEA